MATTTDTEQVGNVAVIDRPPVLAAPPALPSNPFARAQSDSLAAGAVAIESERAIAEAQGKLVIAQRFKRDPFVAFERITDACKRPGLAKSAFYSYKRGGATVSGPSIRLAEELARCWGNLDYGLRELSNREGVSEMEAYAWDMETNTISKQQFTVRHLRDRSADNGGARELTDQRDIYEITANMGARRLRARILAILPDDLVEAAVQGCRRTIANQHGNEPMPERIKRTLTALKEHGITVKHVEEYLGHALDATVPEELADLYGIYQSIKDGQSKVSEWFGAKIDAPATAALTPPAATTLPETAQPPAETTAAATPPATPGRRARGSAAKPPTTPAPATASAPPVTEPVTDTNQQSIPQAAKPAPDGDLF